MFPVGNVTRLGALPISRDSGPSQGGIIRFRCSVASSVEHRGFMLACGGCNWSERLVWLIEGYLNLAFGGEKAFVKWREAEV